MDLFSLKTRQGIADALGTGRIRKVAAQSALLNRNLPQSDFDMLLINLRLEMGCVKDMSFEWKYEVSGEFYFVLFCFSLTPAHFRPE